MTEIASSLTRAVARQYDLLQTSLERMGKERKFLNYGFTVTGDESMEAFLTRRLGSNGARRLAGPLLSGIYAGDIKELSMSATFPQLVELEQKYGSLIRGFLALELSRGGGSGEKPGLASVYRWLRRSGAAQAASPFRSMKRGMATLIDALAATLPPGVVQKGTEVTAIERAEGRGEVPHVHLHPWELDPPSAPPLNGLRRMMLFSGSATLAGKLAAILGRWRGAPIRDAWAELALDEISRPPVRRAGRAS